MTRLKNFFKPEEKKFEISFNDGAIEIAPKENNKQKITQPQLSLFQRASDSIKSTYYGLTKKSEYKNDDKNENSTYKKGKIDSINKRIEKINDKDLKENLTIRSSNIFDQKKVTGRGILELKKIEKEIDKKNFEEKRKAIEENITKLVFGYSVEEYNDLLLDIPNSKNEKDFLNSTKNFLILYNHYYVNELPQEVKKMIMFLNNPKHKVSIDEVNSIAQKLVDHNNRINSENVMHIKSNDFAQIHNSFKPNTNNRLPAEENINKNETKDIKKTEGVDKSKFNEDLKNESTEINKLKGKAENKEEGLFLEDLDRKIVDLSDRQRRFPENSDEIVNIQSQIVHIADLYNEFKKIQNERINFQETKELQTTLNNSLQKVPDALQNAPDAVQNVPVRKSVKELATQYEEISKPQ